MHNIVLEPTRTMPTQGVTVLEKQTNSGISIFFSRGELRNVNYHRGYPCIFDTIPSSPIATVTFDTVPIDAGHITSDIVNHNIQQRLFKSLYAEI